MAKTIAKKPLKLVERYCLGCTIKANPEMVTETIKANPEFQEGETWLNNLWNNPSKCSDMASELTCKMGHKHNKTKCYHPDGQEKEHFERKKDKTCKNSFVIELG